MGKILVVAGGGHFPEKAPLGPWETILGVDSGGTTLAKWKLPAHGIIGDMDSIDSESLKFHEKHKAWIKKFPQDKNETDLELALRELSDNPENEIFLTGIFGGRFDHEIMNLFLLANYSSKGFFTFNHEDGCGGIVGAGKCLIQANSGTPAAIISLSQNVKGIGSTGVKWPLNNEKLSLGESRGISNIIENPPWKLQIREGVVLWILSGVSRERIEIEWHPGCP